MANNILIAFSLVADHSLPLQGTSLEIESNCKKQETTLCQS